jgi:hypothetical protein
MIDDIMSTDKRATPQKCRESTYIGGMESAVVSFNATNIQYGSFIRLDFRINEYNMFHIVVLTQ